MLSWYANWIDRWEYELATKDTNRVVRPFEWGFDFLDGVSPGHDPYAAFGEFHRQAVAASHDFYHAPPVTDYRLKENLLTFTSALPSPYDNNNTVHADFFPAPKDQGRAVVVLPQWNSDVNGHVGLCKLLNKFGITALRMSMAYHDRRMPPELERADYHVSSNMGRTIHATRQSVLDVKSCLSWLEKQGYSRLGLLGTSLGSCVAFITAAHEPRIKCGVFNHVSMYFSDVVWTGLSTQHVRKGFEGRITQDQLRDYWSIISPATFLHRLEGRHMPSLLIWAKYDTTFLPEFSRQVLESFRRLRVPHEVFTLPCAHYTTGKFPFNWMDGLAMCRFLSKNL